jgi:hypothetical protein
VGLERCPLCPMSPIMEVLERKNSCSTLINRDSAVGIPDADHVALCPQNLALTSQTSGCRSVGIVRSRTQTTEIVLFLLVGQSVSLFLSLLVEDFNCQGPRTAVRKSPFTHVQKHSKNSSKISKPNILS